MDKRFQVFVSSTFMDLEEERQEVMHALLELDCMPSGMELFPAANETQWNLIKKVIDDSDYYVLILGGRYGSIGPEGFSYTEMEYRYALSVGKPIIAFVHRDPGKIIANKSEQSTEGREKLEKFRKQVEERLCKQWSTAQELGSVVSRSLIQLIKSTPAVGWVRANELADKDATTELLRLRRRVDELEGDLAKIRISAPKGAEGLAQGDEVHTFRYSFRVRPAGEYSYASWKGTINASWDELFAASAPLMINEADEDTIKKAIDRLIEDKSTDNIRKNNQKLKSAELATFLIHPEDFQTVKVQFRALGLIAKSEKSRSVKDSGTYWTLTPYGDEVMTRLRAIRRVDEDIDDDANVEEGEV